MEVVMLQIHGFALKVCALACFLVIQGFAVLPIGEGIPVHVYSEDVSINIGSSAAPQLNGFLPIVVLPPLTSAPVPQTSKGIISSPYSSPPSPLPPKISDPPSTSMSHPIPSMEPAQAPSILLAPVPSTSNSSSSTSVPGPVPSNSHQTTAPENNSSGHPQTPISPESNAPRSVPPSHSFPPEKPPALILVPDAYSPPPPPKHNPPTELFSPKEPPDAVSPQEHNAFPISTPPPADAPSASKLPDHPISAPHPHHKLTPGPYPSRKFHPVPPNEDKISPAPLMHIIPPAWRRQAPRSAPKANLGHNAPPPSTADDHHSPVSASSPISPPSPAKIPSISPSVQPLQALPPPPPHKACPTLTCAEPLTYGPPESPCVCVLPMQVGISLSVALYNFLPLVSELAKEISSGVHMKQSQVRIMGANADEDEPQKTIALIYLIPRRKEFDPSIAHLISQVFWNKKVGINTTLFGDYDVLYVHYPGLPTSPILPPSNIGIIGGKPYPDHGNNARTVQPLGVDVSGKQRKDGTRRGVLASIIISVFVTFILCCAIAWIFLSRRRNHGYPSHPTPVTTHSLAKSSGRAISILGSGPSSPLSLGSSITVYTGSARTFSANDVDRATEHFNNARILGEGGFGVVYSGALEDGTKVAVKILKRNDQQSDREFVAEVEMLSRLHHRNLVKLIGICIEDRTRCLVYELIPNGSVESHLHGIDKEMAPLDWSARLKIALGAARALTYLHEDSNPRVIHRDFKASNILLEDDYTPKISDFGLARAATEEENTHISTRVMGTFGYVAPEYAMTGHLLVKSDVYSYGVVLLELLTGRKPIDMSQPPGQESLVSWARPLLTTRQGLISIIDPSLGPDFPFDSIAKVGAVASMCVQPEVSHRPFMGEVVQALKLVCNERDEVKETHEDMFLDMEARRSAYSERVPDPLLAQSTVSDYSYLLEVDKDLCMSEALSSSENFGQEDLESFRRNSGSGPLRTGKAKRLWQMMRRSSVGSVSEHGMMVRLWPGSH